MNWGLEVRNAYRERGTCGDFWRCVTLLCGIFGRCRAALPGTTRQTHTWITYDPDKVRNDAVGAPQNHGERGRPDPWSSIRHRKPDEKFDRQVVAYDTTEAPGTVIIDTKDKFLYYVQGGGKALRMGVGVGREGFGWNGTVHIGSKQENAKMVSAARDGRAPAGAGEV